MISAWPMRWRRHVAPGERALASSLVPWRRHLVLEATQRWLIRGAMGACAVASVVLLIGWVSPIPESELRPWALSLAWAPLLLSAAVALWPARRVQTAAELDTRLRLGDRLSTAWAFRQADQPALRLQRDDAIARLRERSPGRDLVWSPARTELVTLGALALIALVLLVARSPQQGVLDRQAAEQLAVQQASENLDALRQEAAALSDLSPEQTRQLDELLQQAQADVSHARSQEEATAALARAQTQIGQQMADPNADLRDEALAAMSETLAAEPRTQALGDALQHLDSQATASAVNDLAAQADQLSDIERQALSRALQRAANVGRSDQRSASALRDAAQALASGKSANGALAAASAALQDSIKSSQGQTSLNTTLQQLRDLQSQLAAGKVRPPAVAVQGTSTGTALTEGTPVPLNASGSHTVSELSSSEDQRSGAGVGASSSGETGEAAPAVQPAEDVYVPGRDSGGPAAQDLVDQPFTLRGQPRPYRDVLTQYAQSSRDYVDRPDISPAVRDMVKQYFQSLEDGS